MGAIANLMLHLLGAALLILLGYYFPGAMSSAISAVDGALANLANAVNPNGKLALLLQFAGAGFAVLMAGFVVAIGFMLRNFVSDTFFRFRRVLMAGFIPLIAYVVKWALGLLLPILLVPVQQMANLVISWFSATNQVRLGLFHAEDHLMTIIIGIVLIAGWFILKLIWRQFFWSRNKPTNPPKPQPPSGKWSRLMAILTKPFKGVRSRARKSAAPNIKDQHPGSGGDIIINPLTWTIIMAALMLIVSAAGSYAIITICNIATKMGILPYNPLTGGMWALLTLVGFLFLIMPAEKKKADEEDESPQPDWHILVIPGPAKGAQVSWFGMVTRFIISTGNCYLLGERLGFGWFPIEAHVVNDKSISRTIADKDGFLLLGPITFQVWHSPTPKSEEEKTTITLQAGNGATVAGNLSFVFSGIRRIRWAEGSDTGLEVGNRGRQELQEVIEKFVDTDVKSLQGDMQRIFRGEALRTAFLPKAVEGFKAGSIIRDKNGKPIYGFDEDDKDLTKRILNDGDEKSLETIKDSDGKILLKTVQVSAPITELLERRGHKLLDVIYDSVRASKEVEEAANKASSEEQQRASQLASARTIRAVRDELKTTDADKNDPHYELGLILAAAQDDSKGAVKVVHLTGANDLTRAMAAAQLATDEGNKK